MSVRREPPEVQAYDFGFLRVDGREYRRDVILLPEGVFHPWWRREGHRLALEDLEPVLNAGVEVLVIGQGYSGRMAVPEAVRAALVARGLEVIVEPTPLAWRTYNRLRGKRPTAAALHLTC